MSLINLARGGLGYLRRRRHPNRVVFHHAPKCGGTSVGRALRRRYLLSQATVLPEATYRAEAALAPDADPLTLLHRAEDLRERMLLYHLAAGVDCVSAHVRFSDAAFDAFHDQARFVTMLREPTARFLSHYRWSHGRPQGHAHIPEPFPEFLETPAAARLGAFYVYFFSGLPPDADMTTADALARAKANLDRLHVVGFLDDPEGFERRIEAEVGVRIRIGRENRGAGPMPDATGHADRIDALTAPDRALFHHARETRR